MKIKLFNSRKNAICIKVLVFSLITFACTSNGTENEINEIRPYEKNAYYWEYKGKPTVLIGGTKQDNLFNFPEGLAGHLDTLKAVGGNYIRNTMSSRDSGNVWPYVRLENGLFDLDKWNDEYWNRLDNLLKLTNDRNIIVQIEIWDPWDYFISNDNHRLWAIHPFNPNNNINYTLAESNLKNDINFRPKAEPTSHNFFHTVPQLENNKVVLKYQQAFVSRILEVGFAYPNVLYCLSNELGEPIDWSTYWAEYIHHQADNHGKKVQVADMRRDNNIHTGDHVYLQNHPELFTFLDISQNNGGSDWDRPEQRHWDPIIKVRNYIADNPRPMNNTKIYGSGESSRGGEKQAIQKFWRSIFATCASVRFHRPPAGLGLCGSAQIQIKSMSMFIDEIDIFSCHPRNDLLQERQPNEAYCLAKPGEIYAIYFTDGGEVKLNSSQFESDATIKWLDIQNSKWIEPEKPRGKDMINIKAPGLNGWIAVVQVN